MVYVCYNITGTVNTSTYTAFGVMVMSMLSLAQVAYMPQFNKCMCASVEVSEFKFRLRYIMLLIFLNACY